MTGAVGETEGTVTGEALTVLLGNVARMAEAG